MIEKNRCINVLGVKSSHTYEQDTVLQIFSDGKIQSDSEKSSMSESDCGNSAYSNSESEPGNCWYSNSESVS